MGYLPDAFHAHFARRRAGHDMFGDMRAALRGRGRAARHRRRDPLRGRRHRRALRRLQRRRAHRPRSRRDGARSTTSAARRRRSRSRRSRTRARSVSCRRDADGGVIAFVEKPAPGKAPSNWINAGTYVLEPSFLDRIPPRLNVSVERETFPRMLAQPGLLFGYQTDALLARHRDAREVPAGARRRARAAASGRPPTPGARELVAGHLDRRATRRSSRARRVEAPVLIGAGARVESGARVRGSVLGAGAVVEAGADARRRGAARRRPRRRTAARVRRLGRRPRRRR